jgi:hypothetical protein
MSPAISLMPSMSFIAIKRSPFKKMSCALYSMPISGICNGKIKNLCSMLIGPFAMDCHLCKHCFAILIIQYIKIF